MRLSVIKTMGAIWTLYGLFLEKHEGRIHC